ncbi:MAG TPA: DUF1934 domain-containing protein [Cerasibacillus sp.]|uniref:DUF1934 domain-containing protein n=1 Tax=Cerasibacillus sp. TaxID=2498711 RepID=UPI002F4267CA
MGQTITITLDMVIDDCGQTEQTTLKETGQYFQRKNFDVLMFTEHHDEQSVQTRMTIHADYVNIKRSGHIEMNQQFRLKKWTENVYQHPYGTIHMETYTKAIIYQRPENAKPGSLILEYDVKLNGQDPRRHRLEVTLHPE